MVRVALGLEYDGTAFSGWQFQSHARSVQGELQRALSSVANHPVEATAAGRTDAGVHALGQIVHFDTSAERPSRSWVLGANSVGPEDLRVLWACEVAADFHARYAALSRSYRYLVLDTPVRPSLDRNRVCWSRRPLDVDAMIAAAPTLVGEHDFAAFRAAECQSRSTTRRVQAVTVSRHGPLIEISVRANAFLHHMVRNFAGVLLAVGTGDRPIGWVHEVLESRDRTRGGVTAPAQGLYLETVEYPPAYGLPTADASSTRDRVCLAVTAPV
jgi:tRNA pseudouridine38-40 synthase